MKPFEIFQLRDLVSGLLKDYGNAAVVVAIIVVVIGAVIVALVIWGLAHSAAAPGTPVKVLWGLVDYTKVPTVASGDLKPVPPPTSAKAPTVASRDLKAPTEASDDPKPAPPPTIAKAPTVASGDPKPAPPPTIAKAPTEASGDPKPANVQPGPGLKKLEVWNGQTPESYKKKIKELRSDHDLRALKSIESGRSVQTSPPGTYFFVRHTERGEGRGPRRRENLLDSLTERSQGNSCKSFEVHHRSTNELLLLAFLRESDAAQVRALTGAREIAVTLVSRPRGIFFSLVELPLEQIFPSEHHLFPWDESIFLVVPNVGVR